MGGLGPDDGFGFFFKLVSKTRLKLFDFKTRIYTIYPVSILAYYYTQNLDKCCDTGFKSFVYNIPTLHTITYFVPLFIK